MSPKHIVVASTAAFALALGGTALAEQAKTPWVSGDEPINVPDEAQIKSPSPGAQAQEKTQEMLNKESSEDSGDYPINVENSAQVKKPAPNTEEQESTEKALQKEDNESGAISGKYD